MLSFRFVAVVLTIAFLTAFAAVAAGAATAKPYRLSDALSGPDTLATLKPGKRFGIGKCAAYSDYAAYSARRPHTGARQVRTVYGYRYAGRGGRTVAKLVKRNGRCTFIGTRTVIVAAWKG